MARSAAALVLCTAACGHSGGALNDAAPTTDTAPTADTAPSRYCPGLTTVSFVGQTAYDVASDGTNVFASLQTGTGAFELDAIPLTGGAAATIAAAFASGIVLAATDGAVFYTLPFPTGGFEVHALSAGTDTTLGTFTGQPARSIAGNATDVYVLTGDTTTTVTRFPRDASGPQTVTTYAQALTQAVPFALGATKLAWSSNGRIAVVALPGPSTVNEVSVSGALGVAFSNDIGVALDTHIATSHSHWNDVEQFSPSTQVLESILVSGPTGTLQGIVGDARYFYVESVGFASQPDQVRAMNVDFHGGGELCEITTDAPLRQDASHLLQLVDAGAQQWRVDVFPKPL